MLPLFNLYLRQEKLRLIIWTVFILLMNCAVPFVMQQEVKDETSLKSFIETLDNPSMIAMCGQVFMKNNPNSASAFAAEMVAYMILVFMFMGVFLTTKITRREEELGNTELLLSKRIGRLSTLISACVFNFIFTFFLSLISFIVMINSKISGMDFLGSLTYNLQMLLASSFGIAIAAIFSQLFSSSRLVLAFSSSLIIAMYLLRAVGDVTNSFFAKVVPIGSLFHAQSFVANDFRFIVIVAFESFLLIGVSIVLRKFRDLGGSYIPERAGRKSASKWLCGEVFGRKKGANNPLKPFGLVFRLTKLTFFGWIIACSLTALCYGSIMNSMQDFINSNDMLKLMTVPQGYTLLDVFSGMLSFVMAILSAVPSIVIMNKLASEEKQGRLESLFVRNISRKGLFSSYYILALFSTLITPLFSAFSFWTAETFVLQNPPSLKNILLQIMIFLPANLILVCLSCFGVAIGRQPILSLSWAYFAWCFITDYFGSLFKFPEFLKATSVFNHIPRIPIDDITLLPLIIPFVIFTVVSFFSFIIYDHRDLTK